MHRLGKWLFDPASRRLSCAAAEHRLSPKAAEVLAALAQTPGQVWAREALMERVWPHAAVGEEVLTHAVAELRRALGDDFRRPTYLETIHRSGYRLRPGSTEPAGFGGLAGAQDWAADLEAYGAYLEASAALDAGGRALNVVAIAKYAQALEMNPGLALAHVGLAKALLFIDYAHEVDLPKVYVHCARARELEGGLGEAHAVEALAFGTSGDLQRTAQSVRTGLALNPGSAEVFYFGARACMSAHALGPAASMLERAARLSPVDHHALVLAGKVRRMLGETDRSRENFAAALPRLDARLAEKPDDFRALIGRARCLHELGRCDEAQAPLAAARAHPDPMHYHLACTLANAGETAAALEALERTVDLGWGGGAYARAWLDRDTDFAPIRDHRRFARIARRVGPAH